jgi:hypothetical protein
MKLLRLFLIVFLLPGPFLLTAQEPPSMEKPSISGYIKYLPSLRANSDVDQFYFDQLLHNRLNLDWRLSENLNFHGALRTRLFQGYTVKNVPFYSDFITQNDHLINASWLVFEEGSFLMHTMSDRFYFNYSKDKWQVRVGRQRINWGINTVSNPNDLFNTYSFFDFDYEERPGADAVRVQYFAGPLSRFEMAFSPGRTPRENVGALLYAFNYKNYDIQLLTGYFKNRWAVGGGWAGSIKQTGFKGEITYFKDLEPLPDTKTSNVVAAVSADHIFQNGSYFVLEYTYNEQRHLDGEDLQFLTRPLRADNLSFTDHSIFANYTYPASPILQWGLAGIYYPTEEGFFLSPNVNYSLFQNFDLQVISQLFFGKEGSVLSEAGYLVAAVVKWSF